MQSKPTSLIVPALGGLYQAAQPFAYPIVRITAGLFLVPHGAQKLFGWFGGRGLSATAQGFAKIGLEPGIVAALLVGATEFFGGLLIAAGFLTRPAAFAAAVVLAVATFKVHFARGFFMSQGGFEFVMLWLLVMIAILIRGGGHLSVDRRIGKEF